MILHFLVSARTVHVLSNGDILINAYVDQELTIWLISHIIVLKFFLSFQRNELKVHYGKMLLACEKIV